MQKSLSLVLLLLVTAILSAGCITDITVGEDCYHGVCTGCDAQICEDGCCIEGRCVAPSVMACGIEGEECFDCTDIGDVCSSEGECLCGGIPCAEGEHCEDGECRCGLRESCGLSGRCIDGQCRCGANRGCIPGQRCEGGACLCDALSCQGCCWGGVTCQPEPSVDACGLNGAECGICLANEACLFGECRCGEGPGCPTERADICLEELACRCGAGPACGEGSVCIDGRCECSPETCAWGCCQEGVCRESTSETCGLGGLPCRDCTTNGSVCLQTGCFCGDVLCPPPDNCVDETCI
jgi:hypothetical protein